MGIRSFRRTYYKQMSAFLVPPDGLTVAPGDIVTVDGRRSVTPTTNLAALGAKPEIRRVAGPTEVRHSSLAERSGGLQGSADLPLKKAAGNLGSTYVGEGIMAADGCASSELVHDSVVRTIRRAMARSEWQRAWRVVRSVTEARHWTLVVGTNKAPLQISLEGRLALGELEAVELNAAISGRIASEQATHVSGTGVVHVTLLKYTLLGNLKRAAAPEETEPQLRTDEVTFTDP